MPFTKLAPLAACTWAQWSFCKCCSGWHHHVDAVVGWPFTCTIFWLIRLGRAVCRAPRRSKSLHRHSVFHLPPQNSHARRHVGANKNAVVTRRRRQQLQDPYIRPHLDMKAASFCAARQAHVVSGAPVKEASGKQERCQLEFRLSGL